jgi:carboxyl-terminal processing protease
MALEEIRKEHNLKGVILDLRQNSGGVLPQAVAVTGLFIKRGIVVSIKDNAGRIEHLRKTEAQNAWDGPLIVLTSKMSASAAEIVAQALQDYGRAIIVGDKHTYGKGTFQTLTLDALQEGKINPKGELKVTRGRYYTVSGKSPQLVGVTPDIFISGIFSEMEIGEQYTKYPLPNDSIPDHFNDTLSDLPPFQRERIAWLYHAHLQPKIDTYTKYLPILRKNAEARLAAHALYQEFIEELQQLKEDAGEEHPLLEFYQKADFQLAATVEIMKDLILLCMEKEG